MVKEEKEKENIPPAKRKQLFLKSNVSKHFATVPENTVEEMASYKMRKSSALSSKWVTSGIEKSSVLWTFSYLKKF